MFTLWLIVAVVLFGVSSYCIGRFDPDAHGDPSSLLWIGFFGSIFWPGVLLIVVICTPFIGLFWLGDRARQKKREAAAKAAVGNQ
jgi:uncharacterized BrkB/YihY/UPF0761 family membrane protein